MSLFPYGRPRPRRTSSPCRGPRARRRPWRPARRRSRQGPRRPGGAGARVAPWRCSFPSLSIRAIASRAAGVSVRSARRLPGPLQPSLCARVGRRSESDTCAGGDDATDCPRRDTASAPPPGGAIRGNSGLSGREVSGPAWGLASDRPTAESIGPFPPSARLERVPKRLSAASRPDPRSWAFETPSRPMAVRSPPAGRLRNARGWVGRGGRRRRKTIRIPRRPNRRAGCPDRRPRASGATRGESTNNRPFRRGARGSPNRRAGP